MELSYIHYILISLNIKTPDHIHNLIYYVFFFTIQESRNKEPKSLRKLFIGGLSFNTDDEKLKEYFSQFGEIVDSVVMKFPDNGR